MVATRFGAKPPPSDTFLHFQPPSNSAAFLPEHHRVKAPTGNRALDSNVEFQRHDKAKKLNLQQARADMKKGHVDNMQAKIHMSEAMKET